VELDLFGRIICFMDLFIYFIYASDLINIPTRSIPSLRYEGL
jgi:hypothetical protein